MSNKHKTHRGYKTQQNSRKSPRPEGIMVSMEYTGNARDDQRIFERGLDIFKNKVKHSGILEEYRLTTYYMSPSVYKRWKKVEAVKKRKRDIGRMKRLARISTVDILKF